MNEDWMNQAYPQDQGQSASLPALSLGQYTSRTFGWMFAGLLTTFLVAVSGYVSGWIFMVLSIPYWHYLLLAAELGTVIFLSARVQKLSVGVARALFFLYAALNGVVFSAYFLLFDLSSMILVFVLSMCA